MTADWILSGVIVSALSLLSNADARPCVELRVRPLIMLSEGDIDVTARVARHPDHRHFELIWMASAGHGGRSVESLDGADSAVWHQYWLRDQPADTYEFWARVYDGAQHVTGEAHARILAPDPRSTRERTP